MTPPQGMSAEEAEVVVCHLAPWLSTFGWHHQREQVKFRIRNDVSPLIAAARADERVKAWNGALAEAAKEQCDGCRMEFPLIWTFWGGLVGGGRWQHTLPDRVPELCIASQIHALNLPEAQPVEPSESEREKWWKLGQWQGWESSAALVMNEKKYTVESHSKSVFAEIVINHIQNDQNVVPIERRTIDDTGALLEPSEGEQHG